MHVETSRRLSAGVVTATKANGLNVMNMEKKNPQKMKIWGILIPKYQSTFGNCILQFCYIGTISFSKDLWFFSLIAFISCAKFVRTACSRILHEGTTDLPDTPLPSLKMFPCNCRKKICIVSIFYKVLLIQELSCILLKTNTISLTCCSAAKSQNSSETHHIAFLASY